MLNDYWRLFINLHSRNDLHLAINHIFKVNEKNTRERCEICSKLTIKTPEQRQWCLSGVFIVNFKHVNFSHLVLVFLLLTLKGKCQLGMLLRPYCNSLEQDRILFISHIHGGVIIICSSIIHQIYSSVCKIF